MTLQELKEAIECALTEHPLDTPVIVQEHRPGRGNDNEWEELRTEAWRDAMNQSAFFIHVDSCEEKK